MYIAVMFRNHGLKIIQAATSKKAVTAATANANGQVPEWFACVPSYALESAQQLKRLGWHGTKEQFRAEIDPTTGLGV